MVFYSLVVDIYNNDGNDVANIKQTFKIENATLILRRLNVREQFFLL